MKTILFTTLALFILCTSCKKKEENTPTAQTPNTPISNNLFSLKGDGVPFTTNNAEVSSNEQTIGVSVGFISETSDYYSLGIKKDLAPGTYSYNGNDSFSFIMYSYDYFYRVDSGSITILSNDTILKKMEATFEFEMMETDYHSDTIQITEGHLNISY
ncbi:hypothetical protein [Fluviicola taffensis]|uniref:Uncharacterized protein n=1 Tax=Fluviicola taffensis (strain DSM 16823 / NCIMB 13979 / RW262) TaxID=755732 RepID=F2ICB7_FLUTR|nr:hypothetical protein [Fluviicola taffensis]AEA44363.1 hypothetical protein Fluta_2377 [Fluviicola taffensis DSM 16823]